MGCLGWDQITPKSFHRGDDLVIFNLDVPSIIEEKSTVYDFLFQMTFFQTGAFMKNKQVISKCSPLKTTMSPKNQCLENVFPTEIVPF